MTWLTGLGRTSTSTIHVLLSWVCPSRSHCLSYSPMVFPHFATKLQFHMGVTILIFLGANPAVVWPSGALPWHLLSDWLQDSETPLAEGFTSLYQLLGRFLQALPWFSPINDAKTQVKKTRGSCMLREIVPSTKWDINHKVKIWVKFKDRTSLIRSSPTYEKQKY